MTRFSPATWFKAAAILCALAGMIIGMIGSSFHPDDERIRSLKIAFLLCVGCGILAGTLHSLWSRTVEGDNATITREGQPSAFWINIVAGLAFSAAVFTLLIVVLLSP